MMEKFYRQDNMKITLGPHSGKGACLEFCSSDPGNSPELKGNQREVLSDIAAFIIQHVQWIDSRLHRRVKASHPFIQGRSDDWLLIEFWTSDMDAIRAVCLILAGRFDFDFEETVHG